MRGRLAFAACSGSAGDAKKNDEPTFDTFYQKANECQSKIKETADAIYDDWFARFSSSPSYNAQSEYKSAKNKHKSEIEEAEKLLKETKELYEKLKDDADFGTMMKTVVDGVDKLYKTAFDYNKDVHMYKIDYLMDSTNAISSISSIIDKLLADGGK